MVKVLAAAPERWRKIYYLSRHPPPDFLFSELGDGASRVEQFSLDFFTDPTEIEKSLRSKINQMYTTVAKENLALTYGSCPYLWGDSTESETIFRNGRPFAVREELSGLIELLWKRFEPDVTKISIEVAVVEVKLRLLARLGSFTSRNLSRSPDLQVRVFESSKTDVCSEDSRSPEGCFFQTPGTHVLYGDFQTGD